MYRTEEANPILENLYKEAMEHLLNGIIALFMSYDDYNVKNKEKLDKKDSVLISHKVCSFKDLMQSMMFMCVFFMTFNDQIIA